MAPKLRIVDAHMHLWDLEHLRYGWLQDDPLPHNPAGDVSGIAYRSYLINDYLHDARGWAIEKMVHVECGQSPAAQVQETAWLMSLAEAHGSPQAIVAGVTLQDQDAQRVLEGHMRHKNVRGIRQIVSFHHDRLRTYTDEDLLYSTAWQRGFALLAHYGLSFDLQIYPGQMTQAAWLADQHPHTMLIINHAGLAVDRDAAGMARWRDGMALLAKRPNVAVKISGLGIADASWTTTSIAPVIDLLVSLFGPSRCMFASDFPVDRVHGSFDSHFTAFDHATRSYTDDEREQLFARTAESWYRI